MMVGAKVCDLTEDLLWFVGGNFDVLYRGKEQFFKSFFQKLNMYYLIIPRFSTPQK